MALTILELGVAGRCMIAELGTPLQIQAPRDDGTRNDPSDLRLAQFLRL